MKMWTSKYYFTFHNKNCIMEPTVWVNLVPFCHIKVLISCFVSASNHVDVVVYGDQWESRSSLLHLCHERPVVGARIIALHAGSIHVKGFIITSCEKRCAKLIPPAYSYKFLVHKDVQNLQYIGLIILFFSNNISSNNHRLRNENRWSHLSLHQIKNTFKHFDWKYFKWVTYLQHRSSHHKHIHQPQNVSFSCWDQMTRSLYWYHISPLCYN